MSNKEYKYYPIFEVFSSFERGKVHSQNTLPDGNSHFYVGAKKNFNGVMRSCGYDESLISKGNCVIFICNGEGSVGYCNYMDRDFMASGDLVLAYGDFLNPYIGLYLVTLLDLERPKYSFGRKYGSHVKSTKILLPTLNDKPDWQYMETFVKDTIIPQLPPKAQKVWLQKYDTKPQQEMKKKLNTDEWKWFEVNEFCDMPYKAKAYNSNELQECAANDDNAILYVTRTDVNNGSKGFVINDNFSDIEEGNAITIGDTTSTIYYQNRKFICGDHMVVLRSKHFNIYTGLFITSLLNRERFRYNYGRAFTMDIIYRTRIKLPVTPEGTPDWQFMEDYIKSLPYSKNIEPSKPNEVVDELVEMKKEMIKMRRAMEAQQNPSNLVNYGTVNIYEK